MMLLKVEYNDKIDELITKDIIDKDITEILNNGGDIENMTEQQVAIFLQGISADLSSGLE